VAVYAYVRVSTERQSLEAQLGAIEEYCRERGIELAKVFRDEAISGARNPLERPGFKELWRVLREGDVLIVPELSRLGRSLKDIVLLASELKDRGVKLVSIKEGITPDNELQYNIMIGLFGILAEVERQLIRERTREGLLAARRRGKRLGRPPKVDKQKLLILLKRGMRPREIAEILGVSVRTVYSNIERLKRAGLVEREERWVVKV